MLLKSNLHLLLFVLLIVIINVCIQWMELVHCCNVACFRGRASPRCYWKDS